MRPSSTAPAARPSLPPRSASAPAFSSGSSSGSRNRAPAAGSNPPAPRHKPAARRDPDNKPPAEQRILFQKFFKSVGPRTYAAQVKEASNGNHFMVLTEGKRDEATNEVRKTRLFLFSEDFSEFFRMLHEVAVFVRDHPVPDEVRQRRQKFWTKRKSEPRGGSRAPASVAPAAAE